MRFERTPFQRDMIDAPLKPGVRKTTYLLASQIAKTESINTIVGYFIHHDPSPMMIVGPSTDFTNDWMDGKIDPMIEATPVLRRIVGRVDGKRRAGQRRGAKRYPGGILFAASAASGKDLRGRSCRVVLFDEIDSYHDIPKEGDPVELGQKRAANFWNRVIIQSSTPTDLETSRICRAFEEGNGQRWHVRCPHCGEEQWLHWPQMKWEEGKPETARYHCEKCDTGWNDEQRLNAVLTGRWIAERPEIKDHESFQLSGLYRTIGHAGNFLSEFVKGYLTARKGGVATYRAWVNTFIAEGYVEEGEILTADPLLNRRENYSLRKIPSGVVRIVCGIDTQDDRWEAELIGYGPGEETWGLGRLITSSAPGTKQAANELDAFLSTRFEHPSGSILEVNRAFIDSGGHHQKDVFDYCRDPRRSHLVYPCHGSTRKTAPPVSGKKKQGRSGVKLFEVGVHSLKNSLYSRLRSTEVGPGYLHFPDDPRYDAGYFAQLTAEKRVTRLVKGVAVSSWEKPAGARNEALDIRVYAQAAFTSLMISNRALEEDYDRMKAAADKLEPDESPMKNNLPKPKIEMITRADLEKMKVQPAPKAPAAAPPEKNSEPSAPARTEKKDEPKLPTGLPANSRWAKKASWAPGSTQVVISSGPWGRLL
jgi:phage terminase large subunit GpA-like protein